jgi:hypothetical protein
MGLGILGLATAATATYLVKRKTKLSRIVGDIVEPILEMYTDVKMGVNKMIKGESCIEEVKELPEIHDMKIICYNKMITLPNSHYSEVLRSSAKDIILEYVLDEELRQKKSSLHISYQYGEIRYRVIVPLDPLSDHPACNFLLDFSWVETGFHNSIEEIIYNNEKPSVEMMKLMTEYAGPLGDFYSSVDLTLDSDAFLNTKMNNRLLQSYDLVEITDALGDIKIFSR